MTQVLIAEDNQILLEDITLELEMRGYEVTAVTDGRAALAALAASTQLPDIIVSDIAMPDIDGFKLLETVRQNPQWVGIPFLFLTAFNSPNSVRISRELGADDYIVKPFQAEDLVLAMENKLKRVQAFQEKAEHELDDARKTLLNMLSHELRTPLTSIYGGTALLSDSLEQFPDEFVHRMLELIRHGAERLNRFTQKAVTILEIDSGHLQMAYESLRRPFDMNEAVREAVANIENDVAFINRTVTFNVFDSLEPLLVRGLQENVTNIVEELLRNAVAFTKDGGEIAVLIGRTDNNISVSVTDDGPGIAEADQERVWDRFVQINREAQEQQGAGLGLAIVRDIVKMHGGSYLLESAPNQGTRITISFPEYVPVADETELENVID